MSLLDDVTQSYISDTKEFGTLEGIWCLKNVLSGQNVLWGGFIDFDHLV